MADLPRLPLELIFHIISSLLGDRRAILPPSRSATKALLAFTLVCRATHGVAANYLRDHCVHIDNDVRLRKLIYCVESTSSHAGSVTARAPALLAAPSTGTSLHALTALYLAPFGRGRGRGGGATLDDQPTAIWVRELFCLVRATLRRLVVDMPLRGLRPADDHLGVRATLREAFGMLTALEEFASVRDELYLDVSEPEWRAVPGAPEPAVWASWPRLRRLALYNAPADGVFWGAVAGMAALETVVLTRADCLEETCIKSEYLGTWSPAGHAGGETTGLGDVGEEGVEPPRPLKVVLVNVSNHHQPDQMAGRWKWDRVDPDNIMKVMTYDVPTSFYGDENPIDLCQDWVKTAALKGDIWDWEGPLVMGAPRAIQPAVFELEA